MELSGLLLSGAGGEALVPSVPSPTASLRRMFSGKMPLLSSSLQQGGHLWGLAVL